MKDKNIIRIVAEDKKLLGTIERHGKALEKEAKGFDGVVRAIKKYDEKNGAARRRLAAARKASAAHLKKAHAHRVKTGKELKRVVMTFKKVSAHHKNTLGKRARAGAAYKKALADKRRYKADYDMLEGQ